LVYWYQDVEKGNACNLIGTPAMIIDRLRAYVAMGVTHFELKFIANDLSDQLDMMRLIAAEIVPAFQSREGT
jgi:hypothetical protein